MTENIIQWVANLWRTAGFPFRVIPRLHAGHNDVYLERYYLLNLGPLGGVFLHCFHLSDLEGLHDHPWDFVTIPLTRGYIEEGLLGEVEARPFRPRFRTAERFHRVRLRAGDEGRVWTLFIHGPRRRTWGFLRDGYEHEYTPADTAGRAWEMPGKLEAGLVALVTLWAAMVLL
jgi:hypothetical protein